MTGTTGTLGTATADELRELAEEAGRTLEGAHPEQVLAWAGRTFGDDLVLASSMGDEVLVHLAAAAVPGIDVIFLDTGYHFAETLGTRDYYAQFTDIHLRTVLPLTTVAEQDAVHGPRLHERAPDRCCAMRKVEPLERGLAPYRAWVTGMRREDAPTRTDIGVVGWDERRGKVKLNPLAAWTQADLDAYVAEHHVVLNPLRELGYASIGCEPCTRAVAPGEDPRAGRWSGTSKTECGLHT
ncbi:phosphoadenylyl-sulfate reductase [Cellulomonas soli]|uniref:Adenosine 5'-phosphosulfate reductase n=1 Tax=Cellulomonas soli TaxID=931535 RepID=A0A512P9Y7_9CELL|nr:phosphoadenylyl-sulfate reductase [Cellulomonas soli]NYI60495.1 phosphoadenosine phosphosulfate reductase [Cellulomonas soli]GEP68010.1 phosphoadenosine phosphosulfate reductase [Cellulomonas soli]